MFGALEPREVGTDFRDDLQGGRGGNAVDAGQIDPADAKQGGPQLERGGITGPPALASGIDRCVVTRESIQHVRQLNVQLQQRLLHMLSVLGLVLRQHLPLPRQRPEHTDLVLRTESTRQQAIAHQLLQPLAISTSDFRPDTLCTCRAFTRYTVKPRDSNSSNNGIQYTPVDSIATVVTPQVTSQSANRRESSVKLGNSRTG